MGRPRSFDWDAAVALRARGLTYKEIAERFGVSANSVACACDPAFRKRQKDIARRLIEDMRHPCFGGCGVLVWGHYGASRESTGYCAKCLGEKRNVVRHGTETEYSQGCRCYDCTKAQKSTRAQRRARRMVPCRACGTLRLNHADSGGQRRGTVDSGLCRDCYRNRKQVAA